MTFNIYVSTEVSIEVEVEAEDEDEALAKAEDALDSEGYIDSTVGFVSNDDEVTVTDVCASDCYTANVAD